MEIGLLERRAVGVESTAVVVVKQSGDEQIQGWVTGSGTLMKSSRVQGEREART
jgi:hypothetical protein